MKKLYIIINKRTIWLEKFIAKRNPDIQIIYSSIVYEMNCQSLRIRKHDDGELYMFGKKLRNDKMDYVDCHELYEEIPMERYIYMQNKSIDYADLKDATVIAMPEAFDFDGYLAIAAFLKTINYDQLSSIRCLAIDAQKTEKVKQMICNNFNDMTLPYFETKFTKIVKERKKNGFESTFPISRDIRYLQMETGMNNIQFAKYFGMSIRNIENWRKEPNTLKDYWYDLLEYKLLKEGII